MADIALSEVGQRAVAVPRLPVGDTNTLAVTRTPHDVEILCTFAWCRPSPWAASLLGALVIHERVPSSAGGAVTPAPRSIASRASIISARTTQPRILA